MAYLWLQCAFLCLCLLGTVRAQYTLLLATACCHPPFALLCPGIELAAAQKLMDMDVLQLPVVSFENQLEGEYMLSGLLD